jgi:dihydrofolate reductase
MAASTIRLIAAISVEGAIAVDGRIPWHYPADLARFARLTRGATVVMGRLTYGSLPPARRPLAGRRNLVVTAEPRLAGAECFTSLAAALLVVAGDAWVIGGVRLFAEAMAHADEVDLTRTPERVNGPTAIYFPRIPLDRFGARPTEVHPGDPRLRVERYVRRQKRVS